MAHVMVYGGNSMKNRFFKYIFFILMLCFLSGCGEKEEETVEYQWVYSAQETAIPSAQPGLSPSGVLEGGQRIRYWSQTSSGNQVCQIMQFQYVTDFNIEQVKNGLIEERADDYYLQRWNTATGSWDSEVVSRADWFPNDPGLASLVPNKLAVGRDGEIYCVFVMNEEAYLGCWRSDSKEILGKFPEEFLELGINEHLMIDYGIFVADDGKLFFYSKDASVILATDRNLSETVRYPVNGSVIGMMEDPSDHQIYWYGRENNRVGIWTLDGHALAEGLEDFDPANFLASFSAEGELYLTDKQQLWVKEKEGEPEPVWKWREQGYFFEKMTDLSADETGTLFLMTYYEESDQLVAIEREWGIPQEKQDVVLALRSYPTQSAFHQLIESFNRQSAHTHVTVQIQGEEESYQDYTQKIQMEISAGRGPDMLGDYLVESGNIGNGYFLSLEGKLEELDGLLPAALDYGRYQGEVYGVPYEVNLSVLVCSEELAAGRSSWNVEEMMESVRQSEASVLHWGLSGSEIVYWFGLSDKDNRDFIDWENGESHLTEEPFLRFLEFAKEYQDQGIAGNYGEVGNLLKNGVIATANANVGRSNFEFLKEYEHSFQDGAVYIGLPKADGRGVYLRSTCIYVNSNSKNTEGCLEFLNYLIAEEAQRKMSRYVVSSVSMPQVGEEVEMSAPFNIRKNILQEQIQSYIGDEGLTQQQAETVLQLLLDAEAWNSPVDQIFSMVSEELDPYFAGERTAKEAAEKLHNRVQLFLDERK